MQPGVSRSLGRQALGQATGLAFRIAGVEAGSKNVIVATPQEGVEDQQDQKQGNAVAEGGILAF